MNVHSAEVVVPCPSLDEALAFFTGRLGMRLEAIFPADAPSVAVVSGHGVRLRLDSSATPSSLRLRLAFDGEIEAATLQGPGGTVVELHPADEPVDLPPLVPSLVVTHRSDGAWGVGRAGMQYRDLIPDRLGGRFIASNIAIPVAGPVEDYVHYHHVRFQMIFVRRGWVRVVYEGQGEPFVMNEGDCVLQPPRIRHRVLENSDAFEVVEVSCPAEHVTHTDWDLDLPSAPLPADHVWSGQRFVRHVAAQTPWSPWDAEGFEARDTGIGDATSGLAGVRVVRPTAAGCSTPRREHTGEFWFGHVLHGAMTLEVDGRDPVALGDGDSLVVPAATPYRLTETSADLELLVVTLPA